MLPFYSQVFLFLSLQEDRTVQVPRFLSPSEGTTQEPWKAEFTKACASLRLGLEPSSELAKVPAASQGFQV